MSSCPDVDFRAVHGISSFMSFTPRVTHRATCFNTLEKLGDKVLCFGSDET